MNKATVPFEDYMKLEKKCDEQASLIEKLQAEIEHLTDKLAQEIQFRQDNFKMIDEMEVYGLNESDFH